MMTNIKKFFIIVLCVLLFPVNVSAANLSFRSTANALDNVDGGDLTVTKPTGTVENDLMFAHFFTADLGATAPTTLTAPAGWTLIGTTNTRQLVGGAYTVRWGVWYRIAGASEGANYTWTANGALVTRGAILTYDNPNTSSPLDTSLIGTFSADATPTASAITNAEANEMVITVFVSDGGGTAPTWTAPSGMNERNDDTGATEDDVLQVASGTTGDKTATASLTGDGYWGIYSFKSEAAVTPPTVTTNAASDIELTSATLNGEITATGGENANERGFAWGTNSALSGGDTSTTTTFGDYGTGTFSQGISGLFSGTQYYFRAYAANTTGTSTGSILNFTTSTDTTPSRKMRLFEGFTIKLISGRIILHQR